MKKIKIVFLGILISLTGLNHLSAQTDFTPAIGVALKTSTNGIGGDVVYNFYEKMNLRLGYETLNLKSSFDFEENSVTYAANVKYKTGSISLLYDYYLSNYIFVTGGAGINLFHADFTGSSESSYQFGDIWISKDKIGTFDIDVDPSLKVSPYLGIGFGRTLGLKKKVGFGFEIGGFYQGSPDLTIETTGAISPTSNPEQGHVARLEKQISQYSIYPILKFSLSYKIAGL
jgi:hypothetical protein